MFVCVLSRYLIPVVVIINGLGISYMLNVCVRVVALSHPSSRVIINGFRISYMLNVCACCRVISSQ